MSEPPIVVVGAGLAGAASAWALARRGRAVVVLEQFGFGHTRGSSHGSARIVRRAYGDELYTRLTGAAFELWRELEQVSGTPLLRMLGGLDFGTRRGAPAVARHLAAAGVPHEVLDPAEAAARFPGMLFDGPVVYHPQAGTMDSAGATAALLDQAALLGATVRSGARVAAVGPSGVRLADGAAIEAAAVVVCAGAWVAELLAESGLDIGLPALRITQQEVFHFPRLDAAGTPWPSVIHESPSEAVYHLAGGRDGGPDDDRKLGLHDHGTTTTATERSGEVSAATRAAAIDYVRRWLPGLDPTPRGEATCLYTRTPTEDFLLDRVDNLVICSPCSGHGAKFAPLIGEWVAALVTGEGGAPARFRLAAHAAAAPGAVSL